MDLGSDDEFGIQVDDAIEGRGSGGGRGGKRADGGPKGKVRP